MIITIFTLSLNIEANITSIISGIFVLGGSSWYNPAESSSVIDTLPVVTARSTASILDLDVRRIGGSSLLLKSQNGGMCDCRVGTFQLSLAQDGSFSGRRV